MNPVCRDRIRSAIVLTCMQAINSPEYDASTFREARVKETRQVIRGSTLDADDPLNARDADTHVHRQCL